MSAILTTAIILHTRASREQLQARVGRTGAGIHQTLDTRRPAKKKRGSEKRRAVQEGLR